MSCIDSRKHPWNPWYQNIVTVIRFCSSHCYNTFDHYTPVPIHQVKSSAPTYFEMPQINHFHQRQPSVYSLGSHQHTGCLRCFTAFLSSVPLGTDKALMPLIAPVKNRIKYKEWIEKHSDALSIQAVTQLPEWKPCREGSSAVTTYLSPSKWHKSRCSRTPAMALTCQDAGRHRKGAYGKSSAGLLPPLASPGLQACNSPHKQCS